MIQVYRKLLTGLSSSKTQILRKLRLTLVFIVSCGFGLLLGIKASAETPGEMPYLDADFKCIADAKAKQYVADFGVDVASFGGLELCNSKVDSKKLFNDLSLIENGKFKTDGQNVYIRGFVDPAKYYSWMKGETRGMDRGNDVPYATAYNRGGYFTMQDGWAASSTLGRVGVVIHEARHTEGYTHIACTQGSYQGSSVPGCDRDYTYGGSHAIEMEYYANVSVRGLNFHPVYKTMARLMGIARSNFVFNKSPIVRREGLLAIEKNSKQGLLYVDGKIYEREAPSVEGTLKRTSYGGVIMDGQHAYSVELYEKSGFRDLIDDAYSYFKLLTRETAGKVFDFEEYDVGTQRYLVQINSNQQISSYDFPNGAWKSFKSIPFKVQKTATTLENGQKGYFLIDSAGAIYSFSANNLNIGPKLTSSWNNNLQSIASLGNDLYVLKNDGNIYLRAAGQPETLWRESQTQYTGLTTVPLYDGFTVQP